MPYVSIISFGNSDHELLSYTRFCKDPPEPPKTIVKRSFKNFSADAFLIDIESVDWLQIYLAQDVDLAVQIFTSMFLSVLDKHAPWVRFQRRKFFAPWITQETIGLIKERNMLKDEAIKASLSHSNEERAAWNRYRALRNKITNKKRNEEEAYKKRKIAENLGSAEKTWQITKGFMGWRKLGSPGQLIVNNSLIRKPAEVASCMNDFFLEKVAKISKKLSHSKKPNLKACSDIMKDKNCKLSLQYVTVNKVKKLLKKLKNSKCAAVDGLDNYTLKLAADVVAKPLHHIITLSIMQMKFPTHWKHAKIIPLHKKGDPSERKNYRPVSILSPLGKILEKVVFGQIYDYFEKNHIFHENIHGYRKYRSTQTALLEMYDKWIKAANSGQLSGVLLLDLSAAFDIVSHKILIEKLEVYGLTEDYRNWIKSYLQDRKQAVWIDNCYSDFLTCDTGVPQGSNLGPLFFLIFYNDLPYTLDCDLTAYADDSSLTAAGMDVSLIEASLTENFEKVSTWMTENRLKLNTEKTHILTMGTGRRLGNLENKAKLHIGNTVIQEDQEKYEVLLGVKMQANLKWNLHVEGLKGKLKTRLAGLNKLKYIVPFETLKTIVQGIFTSILVYCLPLYGGCDKGEIKDLQILQNKAAQIVTKVPPRFNRNFMFDKLNWMTVNQLVAYHTGITIYKIRKNGHPEYLAKIFKETTFNGNIRLPRYRLELAERSFSIRGSKLWNSMPSEVKAQEKITGFKKAYRKWVIEHIPRFCD